MGAARVLVAAHPHHISQEGPAVSGLFGPVTREDIEDCLDASEAEEDEYLDFLYGNDPEDEPTYDLGVCQSCGGYGRVGTTCGRTDRCREYGSEFM